MARISRMLASQIYEYHNHMKCDFQIWNYSPKRIPIWNTLQRSDSREPWVTTSSTWNLLIKFTPLKKQVPIYRKTFTWLQFFIKIQEWVFCKAWNLCNSLVWNTWTDSNLKNLVFCCLYKNLSLTDKFDLCNPVSNRL